MRASWIVAAAVALACHGGRADHTGPATVPPPVEPSASASLPGTSAAAALDATPSAQAMGTDAGTTPDATPPARLKVYIQPLGKQLSDETISYVKQSLLAFYDLDVLLLERAALPDWARNRARTRYRAEKLLELLDQRLPAGGFRILGLTGADISTTKGKYPDWGILGLATVDGRMCIISSFRTRRLARGKDHARIRLGKTAVHEIGHTLGLPHCPNRGCLMEDAMGTVLTTDREYDLCGDCREQLLRRGHPLADATVPIPWPEP